jgi:hypothetical protein
MIIKIKTKMVLSATQTLMICLMGWMVSAIFCTLRLSIRLSVVLQRQIKQLRRFLYQTASCCLSRTFIFKKSLRSLEIPDHEGYFSKEYQFSLDFDNHS